MSNRRSFTRREFLQKSTITGGHFTVWTCAVAGARFFPALAAEITNIAPQPYFAGVKRAIEALAKLGAPVADDDAQQIDALARQNDSAAVDAVEKILDRYTLASLAINMDGSSQVSLGGAPRTLVEQGWRMFLVRVKNPAGRTEYLGVSTDGAGWDWWGGTPGRMVPGWVSDAQRGPLIDTLNKVPVIEKMWLLLQLYETTPMLRYGREVPVVPLSGLPIEYRVVQLFSRDQGRRSAKVSLYTLPHFLEGIYGPGHREFDFECLPSRTVTLGVLDADGRGCVASLTIKDHRDYVYPPQAMRLAPDMFFQEHVYRADGETVRLPDGEYRIEGRRGPEYLRTIQTVKIDADHTRINVQLDRWINPAHWGWYSGDTHVHAAGCAHYQIPTEGVSPDTMIRHVRGEGLTIGDILTWGPSWYYQKQFFTGLATSPQATLEHPELQAANNTSFQPRPTPEDTESLLRYDMEVSGFPSSHCGHLVLLRLKEQDYPGTKLIEDWPSWNLPIMQWAKAQGAVVGYAHAGIGMVVESTELPNFDIPPMDAIGTNEAIVDVTHGAVDFLSGCDTQPVAELNAWYHLLNCGFHLGLVGETDYPCISAERPGVGRSYVWLEHRPTNDAGYEAWIDGLRQGRLYCGDGRSHFLDFKVNGRRSGEEDLAVNASETLNIEALVAARLESEPPADMEAIKHPFLNGWHLENARIGTTREVAVELVVNGLPVEKTTLIADGTPRSIKFRTKVTRSSWIALRILPSAHTHPVFVQLDTKPIRASKRSAQWCRACVDKLWEVRSSFMRERERPAASEAFDHARKTYDAIIEECGVV